MTIKFSEKVSLGRGNELIVTYRAQALDLACFAYVKCNEAGLKLMRADQESGKVRALSEYGKVIYRDNITDPDAKAIEFLKNYIAENGGELM